MEIDDVFCSVFADGGNVQYQYMENIIVKFF